jgi:hypothetical protein
MDDAGAEFDDLEAMAEQVSRDVWPDLFAILERGISLYEADDDGNVFEIAPNGRRFLVEFRDDKFVRVRDAGYIAECDVYSSKEQA